MVAVRALRTEQVAKIAPPAGQGGKLPQARKYPSPVPPAQPAAFKAPAATPPSATTLYAHALVEARRRRANRMLGWFCALVLAPTIAAAMYFLIVATPRYTSEFEFTYQTYRGPQSLASGLVESVTGTSQQNTVDLGTIVYEYLQSQALIDQLDKELDLHKHFAAANIDWWSRLPADSSHERFLDYVRSRFSVMQGQGGYLSVKVTAFDRDFSLALAKAVIAACDKMVDDLNMRARQDQVGYAEAELARQEDRLRKARLALTQFQNEHGSQDPSRTANQLGTIVGTIESDLANAKTQLASAESSLSSKSPIVIQLKQNIASLQAQLKAQQERLATDKTTNAAQQPYSEVLEQYSALQIEEEFAKNAYLAAQQGVTVARAEAAAKQNYLIDFAAPARPDRMNYLEPLEAIACVFFASLVLFWLGNVVVGATRHGSVDLSAATYPSPSNAVLFANA